MNGKSSVSIGPQGWRISVAAAGSICCNVRSVVLGIEEQPAHEKCRRRDTAPAPAWRVFSLCSDAGISGSICSPPLSLVAEGWMWRVQGPLSWEGCGPCGWSLVNRPEGPSLPCATLHLCVQLSTPPGRRHCFYSKLNKNCCVGSGFSCEKQVPGTLGRISECGLSFPTQEQMVRIGPSCDLPLLLRHQISDPMDRKYSVGLQPWRWGERQAVVIIFHLSGAFGRKP